MMFICLMCCLRIVPVDLDIEDKQLVYICHKIFLEKRTNHLVIKNIFFTEVSGTLEKNLDFSGTFFFMPIEALREF